MTGQWPTRTPVESYFFKLNDAVGRRALWLKATVLSRLSGAGPVAEAWAIAFDREGEHVAAKEVVAYESARFSRDGLSVKVSDLKFEEGRLALEIGTKDPGHGVRMVA